MTRCEPFREALAATDSKAPGLREHLASCEACRAFAADVERLATLARALPTTSPRGARGARGARVAAAPPRSRLRGLAIAAALLLAAGALVWGLSRDGDAPRQGQSAAERSTATIQPDLFAALERAQAVWTPENGDWTDWLELPGAGERFRMELLERDFEPRDPRDQLFDKGEL